MDWKQIAALVIMSVFYGIYFGKLFLQRRQGVQTNQLGKGEKSPHLLLIEKLVSVATALTVPVELASILFNTHWISTEWARITGLFLSGLGVTAFLSAVLTMRDSWRAGICAKKETALVQTGIYRISRNPAFLGFDLTYLGLFLAFSNPIHLAAFLFAACMLHLLILQEERWLPSAFGEEYTAYRNRTARYFLFL